MVTVVLVSGTHCLLISGSTIQRARVLGQFPPRLYRVFSKVM